MNCKDLEILISTYVDGELGEIQTKKLKSHIDQCSACRRKVESTRALSERLRGLMRVEGSVAERNNLLATLHEKLANDPVPAQPKSWIASPRIAWVGAVAAVIIILAVVFIPDSGYNQRPDMKAVEPPELALYEDELIAGMVQYMQDELVFASSHEVFAEPVIALYGIDHYSEIEGGIDYSLEFPRRDGR